MKNYRIANENDKEKFYQKLHSEIENTIWKELINGQHDHLEVEVNIVPVKTESEG
jgi:hypothetical protein